ncbi:MAG: WbqC family protein [Deltaproteobacteria bacterium]|nr:WbqC family protein [Deltaproteobacteria bacterium]
MIAICQQPNYFPWLGYLEQCARADVFVVLDSVQWIRQGRQHRTRILPQPGKKTDFQWLTLPVRGHGHRLVPLRSLELDAGRAWADDHWKTIRATYARRPYFKSQLEPLVAPWFGKAAAMKTMCEAALSSVRLCLEALELRPEIVLASELPEEGVKTERLLSLCRAVGADTYYSALGSTRYVDVGAFRASGIRLVWQHWKHPEYTQGGERRKTHLSILDALANVPLDELKAWLAPKAWGPFGDGDRP